MRIGPIKMQDACDIIWLMQLWWLEDYSGHLFDYTRGNVQAYFWN